ncbi:hypothetical protein CCACVL1_21663 [Corchorus capsularis]|uniref:Uncharacterized protein n=1 Tax=Corchorus capsularis TaxID=210143 RepID=A0A1R3H2H9_COCAP|nr:hypothetical protein CCACVL1_21663 [Corchorus capsularis]
MSEYWAGPDPNLQNTRLDPTQPYSTHHVIIH